MHGALPPLPLPTRAQVQVVGNGTTLLLRSLAYKNWQSAAAEAVRGFDLLAPGLPVPPGSVPPTIVTLDVYALYGRCRWVVVPGCEPHHDAC